MKTTTCIKQLPRLALVAAATWLLLQLVASAGLFFEHGWTAICFPYALDYGAVAFGGQIALLPTF
ncbi:MAG: hypothetical protein JXA89_11280 [Anaerolineae bacterium]|nr:hypothetical protein [Anaerolineae bacterium]